MIPYLFFCVVADFTFDSVTVADVVHRQVFVYLLLFTGRPLLYCWWSECWLVVVRWYWCWRKRLWKRIMQWSTTMQANTDSCLYARCISAAWSLPMLQRLSFRWYVGRVFLFSLHWLVSVWCVFYIVVYLSLAVTCLIHNIGFTHLSGINSVTSPQLRCCPTM